MKNCLGILNNESKIFGESGLVGLGSTINTGRFPVQTPLGTQSSLGTQLCYEAPGDLQAKIVKKQWLKSSGGGYSLHNCGKLAVGQPNSS